MTKKHGVVHLEMINALPWHQDEIIPATILKNVDLRNRIYEVFKDNLHDKKQITIV